MVGLLGHTQVPMRTVTVSEPRPLTPVMESESPPAVDMPAYALGCVRPEKKGTGLRKYATGDATPPTTIWTACGTDDLGSFTTHEMYECDHDVGTTLSLLTRMTPHACDAQKDVPSMMRLREPFLVRLKRLGARFVIVGAS